MDYLLKKGGEYFRGVLHLKDGSTVPFFYRSESPRRYEEYNAFIQGMEFIKATATLYTSARLALTVGDRITLQNGATLVVKSFQPVENPRKAMRCKDAVVGWIINLG